MSNTPTQPPADSEQDHNKISDSDAEAAAPEDGPVAGEEDPGGAAELLRELNEQDAD